MNLRVTMSGKDKCQESRIQSESEPETGVLVRWGRRETKWSTLAQVEVRVTPNGGPHQ